MWAWLGPTLLFVGAMITLWVTNFRADKREWNKWRRDTLVKLCADAITESQEAVAMCESALSQARHVSAQANLTSASKAAARIGTIAEQLYLINANYLADACASMRTAADAINSPASQLRTANINASSRRERELKQLNEQGPGWFVEGSDAEREYMAKFSEIHERIHQQMVAEYETRYSEARDQLEAIRARFLERGRIELKPIS